MFTTLVDKDRRRGRWLQAFRARHLRMHPLCERCLQRGVVRPATQVDHKVALTNGGKDFDEDPSQANSLCDPCHVDKTNEDMGRAIKHPVAADGVPTDPGHPWNINAEDKGGP